MESGRDKMIRLGSAMVATLKMTLELKKELEEIPYEEIEAIIEFDEECQEIDREYSNLLDELYGEDS